MTDHPLDLTEDEAEEEFRERRLAQSDLYADLDDQLTVLRERMEALATDDMPPNAARKLMAYSIIIGDIAVHCRRMAGSLKPKEDK